MLTALFGSESSADEPNQHLVTGFEGPYNKVQQIVLYERAGPE